LMVFSCKVDGSIDSYDASDCFLHSGPYSRSCGSVVNYTPTSSACSYVTVR